MISKNPILNSPYLEPTLHYDTDSEGNLDYNNIVVGRRIFKPDSAVIPTRQTGQKEVFEWNDDAAEYGTHIINLCRKEIEKWRSEKYPNTTRVTAFCPSGIKEVFLRFLWLEVAVSELPF